jgi:cytochrome c oxidase assembly protein subunit 11
MGEVRRKHPAADDVMEYVNPAPEKPRAASRKNWIVAASCLAFFSGMIGVTYASAELYSLFCQVTGYGGATQRAEQASARILDKKITVRFDANVAPGLPWTFQPVQRSVEIKIGETAKVSYSAANIFSAPTHGKASFNVTPELAGAYFNKLECFCFTDTVLKPGETLEMPVVFFVDPEIVNEPDLKNLDTITLSYTFFPSVDEKPLALAPKPKVIEKPAGQL